MILIFHIIVALGSLAYTGYVFLFPSKKGLIACYFLVVATLASGTYLVVAKPAHLTQTCAEGLVYLVVVGCGIIAARYKLLAIKKSPL